MYFAVKFICIALHIFAMLDSATAKKINEFVYAKPRTIQEIALLLNVNWRTADNYISKISEEQGTIAIRVFREGTRGALKVAFWNNTEKPAVSEVQQQILKKLETGRRKEDFSPLDIYQFADEKKRRAFADIVDPKESDRDKNIILLLKQAEKEIYIFSGNLSLVNLVQGKEYVLSILEELAPKVNIRILTRVEAAGIENIRKVLAINSRVGRNAIEIRHSEQPLRAIIIDNKLIRLREIKVPETYRTGELKNKTYIYYEIFDENWVDWLQKVFWHMFRPAVDAQKRIVDLESIKKLI